MEYIEKGDRVNIAFWPEVNDVRNALVMDTPKHIGDDWILKGEDGSLIYVQHYAKMERIPQ